MKETRAAVSAELEKKDRQRKFVEVAYGTGTRSTSSSDRAAAYIPSERTNKQAYREMSEKRASDLPPCNDMTAGSKSLR